MANSFEPSRSEILHNLARTFLYTNWGGLQPTVREYAVSNQFTEDEMWDGLRFVIASEAAEQRNKPELQKKVEGLEEDLQSAIELARVDKELYSVMKNIPDVKQAYLDSERRVTNLRTQIGRMLGA